MSFKVIKVKKICLIRSQNGNTDYSCCLKSIYESFELQGCTELTDVSRPLLTARPRGITVAKAISTRLDRKTLNIRYIFEKCNIINNYTEVTFAH